MIFVIPVSSFSSFKYIIVYSVPQTKIVRYTINPCYSFHLSDHINLSPPDSKHYQHRFDTTENKKGSYCRGWSNGLWNCNSVDIEQLQGYLERSKRTVLICRH
jgi:hypothetical protein